MQGRLVNLKRESIVDRLAFTQCNVEGSVCITVSSGMDDGLNLITYDYEHYLLTNG